MAKIKFTAFMAEARNKVAGSVFSKNHYGNYIRTKTSPSNAQTTAQMAQRQMLGSLSAAWRGLSQSERASWEGATDAFLRTDVFGDQLELSANALYVSLNKNLINAGKSKIDTAPSPVEMPTIGISDLKADESTPKLEFTFSENTIPSGFALLVKATAPISPGKKYVKNLLRFIGTETATSGTVDILSDYQAKFGNPIAGQRISVQAYLVSENTGQAGVPVSATVIVQP